MCTTIKLSPSDSFLTELYGANNWAMNRISELASVVQKVDSAIHRINHYPADEHYQNQLSYPVDSDLSSGYRYPPFEQPGPGV